MSCVVALDAGTTSVRALAFDEEGHIVGSAARRLTQRFPRPGWVEHDPVEIRDGAFEVLQALAASLSDPVAAIGITNQRETAVAWDRRDGRPLHPAIVWQDRRTAGRCEDLVREGHAEEIRSRTGLVADPYFSATKFEWLVREAGVGATPGLALGTVDAWLCWNLTEGTFATDVSNASRTMLYDIGRGGWSEELLDLFGLERRALPEVRPSSGRFGLATSAIPALAGVPVSGIAGDQQASLFGQACLEAGATKCTYGTGSFVLMNLGTSAAPRGDGLITTVAWQLATGKPVFALEGSVFVTGAGIQWLVEGLGLAREPEEVGALAASVEGADGSFLVPAFAGLGSPWWDPGARAVWTGLARGIGRAQLARAIVEAMAYQARDVVDAMEVASGCRPPELRVDGGAAVMDILCQLQADQVGSRVMRSATKESTAWGAAGLAGIAEGVWASAGEVASRWSADAVFEPGPGASDGRADAAHAGWLEALERSRAWVEGPRG